MREQSSELIEAISRMEKAGDWQVVCYLLELVQRRASSSVTDVGQKEKMAA
jgi:hypothetical protein